MKLNGMSLFTGAGGMDIGFERAGINIIVANELSKDAADTHASNHPNVNLLRGDINDHFETLREYCGSIDVLFGGPPCQGFSVAGKMDPMMSEVS
jgi:DNA (cytosine-5)-methyltransferase 1